MLESVNTEDNDIAELDVQTTDVDAQADADYAARMDASLNADFDAQVNAEADADFDLEW